MTLTQESSDLAGGNETLKIRGGELLPPVFIQTKKQVPDLELFKVVEGLYLVGTTTIPARSDTNESILHVDGIGVFQETLLQRPTDIASLNCSDLIGIFSEVRGAIGVFTLDTVKGIARILPDPLGGGVIYSYKSNGFEMISTSMSALVETARRLGLPLTKSPIWFAELIATESGGLGADSSYSEIQSLPPGAYAEMTGSSSSTVKYRSTPWDQLGSSVPSEELLDLIVEEMLSNARAFAKSDGPKVAHLSAGGDSRLSAATLVRASVADDFRFYCAGNSISRENLIASEVAQHLGLRMTSDSGLRTPVVPRTAFESVAVALIGSQGMKHYAPFKSTLHSEGIILTGMYGGIQRSFYSSGLENLDVKDGRSILSSIWGKRLHHSETGILNQSVIEQISEGVDSKLQVARSLGVREDAIGDYLYAAVRQRYFGAHTLMETSRYVKQGSVLYSPSALRYSLSLPLIDRHDGRLVFELYSRLLPKALQVRFDSEKFGPTVQSDPRFPDLVSYSPQELKDKPDKMQPERVSFGVVPRVPVTKAHKSRAQKIGIPAWRIAYEPVAREMIHVWVKQHPDDAATVFNLKRLESLISSSSGTKAEIRLITRIASYLPWFSNASF